MTVEAAAAEVLSLFGGGVVCMLDGKAGVRREVRHGHGVARGGGGRAVKGGLGGDDDRSSVFEFYGGVVVMIVLEFVVRGVGRGVHGGNKGFAVKCRRFSRKGEWLSVQGLIAGSIRMMEHRTIIVGDERRVLLEGNTVITVMSDIRKSGTSHE